MSTPWPTRPDGQPMRFGDIDPATRRRLIDEAVERALATPPVAIAIVVAASRLAPEQRLWTRSPFPAPLAT